MKVQLGTVPNCIILEKCAKGVCPLLYYFSYLYDSNQYPNQNGKT